jgi:phage tail sheath gpL-like
MPVGFDTIPAGAVASMVAIEQKYRKAGNSSPGAITQRIALIARFLAAKTPAVNVANPVTNADEVAAIAGYGSEAHLMAITLFANMGNFPALVDYFPLTDGTTAATGTVVFATNASSAGQWTVYIAGKPITISVASGDTPTVQAAALSAAINADITLPVTASPSTGTVTLTSKWKGASANLINIMKNYTGKEINLQPGGTTMTVTTLASGATDPTLPTLSTMFGTTFYTWILMGLNDATSAAALETCFTTRVGALIKKPTMGVMGYVDTRANFLTALGSVASPVRNSPGSCYVPVEGSPMYPGQIAAAVVGQGAVSANADPGRSLRSLPLLGILPGFGVAPWDQTQAEAVEQAGGSVTEIIGGQVVIKDLLTTYKTNAGGAADSSFRYVETVCNIQNKEYQIDTMFRSDPFTRATVITDDDLSSKDYAINPKTVKAYVTSLINTWIANNWSVQRDAIIAGLIVEIDSGNPGRFNILLPDRLSTPLRIVAVSYQWSFAG